MNLQGVAKSRRYDIHNDTRVLVIRALRVVPLPSSWEDEWPEPYQRAFEAVMAMADDLYLTR